MYPRLGLTLILMLFSSLSMAQSLKVVIYELNIDSAQKGIGAEIGSIEFEDSDYGLLIRPDLHTIPGMHGLHVHQNPNCEGDYKGESFVAGLKAGGHFDPQNTGEHLGPYADGHLGDLPPLFCQLDGHCNQLTLAPRLKREDLAGRSIMIHINGDNFSDSPKPLGGGGGRMACGVV